MAVDCAGREDLAVAGEDLRLRADYEVRVDAVHRVGLPALPSATIRPSRIPTSALITPQWSSTIAPVMTRSGCPARGWRSPCPSTRDHLPAAEHGLLAAEGAVLLDLDQEVGVGQANAVACGGSVERGIPRAADLAHGRQSVCGPTAQSVCPAGQDLSAMLRRGLTGGRPRAAAARARPCADRRANPSVCRFRARHAASLMRRCR